MLLYKPWRRHIDRGRRPQHQQGASFNEESNRFGLNDRTVLNVKEVTSQEQNPEPSREKETA